MCLWNINLAGGRLEETVFTVNEAQQDITIGQKGKQGEAEIGSG